MLSILVTFRHVVLPIGALAVLVAGLYLFVEVRAQPAPPIAAPSAPAPVTSPAPVAPATDRASRPSPIASHVAAAHEPVAPPRPAAPPPPSSSPPPTLHDADAGAAADPNAPLVEPKLDAVMAEANRAYDRGDYDEAKQTAARVLAQFPTNVRMLRIMVSSSCIDGDAPAAQAHFQNLPAADQEQMKIRCARYGVVFTDKS